MVVFDSTLPFPSPLRARGKGMSDDSIHLHRPHRSWEGERTRALWEFTPIVYVEVDTCFHGNLSPGYVCHKSLQQLKHLTFAKGKAHTASQDKTGIYLAGLLLSSYWQVNQTEAA